MSARGARARSARARCARSFIWSRARSARAPIPLALIAGLFTLLVGSRVAPAQSVLETNLRAGPQFVRYQLSGPVNETISQLAVPIFVVVPVSSILTVDVGTAYAWSRVESNGGASGPTSTISGPTDTQVRANVLLGSDFVVLTGGLNIPTGQSTASPDEQLAAFRIGSDFLSFPISSFGTGFGMTGGIAIARPLGAWSVGAGGSVRHSASYEPIEDNSGGRPRFQPGNEYRLRVGADRPFGTGRLALAATMSKFGDDDISGSIYNTGDRYVLQGGFTNSVRSADVVLDAWSMYRTPGTIYTGERVGPETITNLLVGVGFRTRAGVLEPSLEARSWQQRNAPASVLATLGLRYTVSAGAFVITPSVGYTAGRFGTLSKSTSLSGVRGAVAIRADRS